MTKSAYHWWAEGFDYGLFFPAYDDDALLHVPHEHRQDWIRGFDAAQIRRTFGLGLDWREESRTYSL